MTHTLRPPNSVPRRSSWGCSSGIVRRRLIIVNDQEILRFATLESLAAGLAPLRGNVLSKRYPDRGVSRLALD